MQRCIQLTDTNSPCGLFFFKTSLIPCQLYIFHISLVSIEKRVYPIPFRTRQSSSSSPMILHTFVWESRPMPRFSLERSSYDGLSSFKAPCVQAGRVLCRMHVFFVLCGLFLVSRGLRILKRTGKQSFGGLSPFSAKSFCCPLFFFVILSS